MNMFYDIALLSLAVFLLVFIAQVKGLTTCEVLHMFLTPALTIA